MHRRDEPITIVPDVEDDKSFYVVCIGKTGPQLHEILPPG